MITKDGFAAIPWGRRFVIIHNGFQIGDVKNLDQAKVFIDKERKNLKSQQQAGATAPSKRKSRKNKKTDQS
jgi:ABC-type uncharacterized transport system ATPase component